jgi:iron complex transport system permease protein
MTKQLPVFTLIASISLVLLLILNISFGSSFIPPTTWLFSFFDGDTTGVNEILWQFRLPRAITCVVAGAGLAVGGLMMQTLFRNPLAGPDVLGLSSGASLMVALVLMLGLANKFFYAFATNAWGLALAATMGSAAVFLLVMVLAQIVRDNTSLLLVGVVQFISQASDLQLFLIWSLGNVGGTNWQEITVLVILLVVGTCIYIGQIKALNGHLLGEIYAQSLGINIKQSRLWIVLGTSLLTGGITAFCGPIAFVGLAVPHLVRMVMPISNHRQLLPMVMLGGGCLLLLCDWLAHLFGSIVLPLNAITSIIGAPLVIWMLLKNKKVVL